MISTWLARGREMYSKLCIYGQFLLIDNGIRMVINACGNAYCMYIFNLIYDFF